MKKSLWGYHIAQTDEQLASLEEKNDALTAKVTDLTLQLGQLREEAQRAQKLAEQAAAEKETYQNKAQQLQKEASELSCKLEKAQKAASVAPDVEEGIIGRYCERAYQDMDRMKRETVQEMLEQIDAYQKEVETSNAQTRQIIGRVTDGCDEMSKQLNDFTEVVCHALREIMEKSAGLEDGFLRAAATAKSLKEKVSGVADIQKGKESAAGRPAELEKVLEGLSDAVAQHKAAPEHPLEQKSTPRIIGIHTKVNSSDILGNGD